MEMTLKFKLKNKEIKLNEDEARELYNRLDEMFGVRVYSIDRYINPNPYFPTQPSVTYNTSSKPNNIGTIWFE